MVVINIKATPYSVIGAIDSRAFYHPEGIAISSGGAYAYVTNNNGGNYGLGNILIIDEQTSHIIKSIESAAFDNPDTGLAFSPSGSYAYITNSKGGTNGNGNIVIVSTATNAVEGSINSASFDDPVGVSFSPISPYAFVTNNQGGNAGTGNILVISTTTNTVFTSIDPSGGLGTVAVSPDGTYAYVVDSNGGTNGNGNIMILDTATFAFTGSIESAAFADPIAVAFSPDGTEAAVANRDGGINGNGNILLIDTASNTVFASIASNAFDTLGGLAFPPPPPPRQIPPILYSSTSCYAEVNISNNQNSATGPLFNQMLNIPMNKYSSCANKNLSNMLFTLNAPADQASNTPVYAWIESGASNSSANTIVWLNLQDGLGATGSFSNDTTVYMNFLSDNSPVTSGYTGYAPTLRCTSGCFQNSYAQYDNGAKVFDFYDNFAGTTLNMSKWHVTEDCFTYAVNDGFSLTGFTNNCGYSEFGSIQSPYASAGPGTVVEFSGSALGTVDSYDDRLYTGSTALGANPIGSFFWSKSSDSTTGCTSAEYAQSFTYVCSGGLDGIGQNGLWSISLASASTTYFQFNYGTPQQVTYPGAANGEQLVVTLLQFGVDGNYNTGGPSYNVQWIRERGYPPNGVMPSASFSKLVPLSVSANTSAGYLLPSQSATLTANVIGGTAPYAYQWYEEAPGQSVYSTISGATSNTYAFTAPSSPIGSYSFIVSASGNPDYPLQTANSLPVNVTVYNNYAYVANSDGSGSLGYPYGNVVIIDTSINTITGTITSGISGPFSVAFSPDGTYAYATNVGYRSNNVVIINTSTQKVTGAITSGIDYPIGVAFSPSGTYAYVVNGGSGNVVIVDTKTNKVTGAINTTGDSIAISPDGTYAYLTGYDKVMIINTATNTVVGAINGGPGSGINEPIGITFAPNGGYAYITNGAKATLTDSSNNVTVINTATGRPVNEITLGLNDPTSVAITPNGAFLYVTNSGSGNIVIINAITNQLIGSINSGVHGPTGVAFLPTGTYSSPTGTYPAPTQISTLYATAQAFAGSVYSGDEDTLSVSTTGGTGDKYIYSYQWYEEQPGQSSYSIIGESPYYAFTAPSTTGTYSFKVTVYDNGNPMHPQQATSVPVNIIVNSMPEYAYVTNYYANNVVIVSTATNTVIDAINHGFSEPSGVAFSQNGAYAYVVNRGFSTPGSVVIINTATKAAVGAITSDFWLPDAIAISPNGNAYVTNDGSSNVVIINTATDALVGSIKSGINHPNGIAIAPNGYGYITNYGSGGNANVVIFNTATNLVVGTVNLGLSDLEPEGVAISPDGKYAYVAATGIDYRYSYNPTGEIAEIAKIDTTTNLVTNTIISGINNPGGIAVSPNGAFAYAVNNDQIAIINTATNAIVTSITSGFKVPFGVAFHPG